MEEIPDLIIVRGAPAVGKSTLAKRIRQEFHKGFLVEVDNMRCILNSVDLYQKQQHLNALDATASLIKSYLKSGYSPGIVIDSFDSTKLSIFTAKFKKINFLIISLYASNDVLKNRLLNRENGFKDWTATKYLNEEIINHRNNNEILLDTSESSKEQVAQSFLQAVLKTKSV